MPAVVVSDDLVVRIGRHRAPLSPSQAFSLAERLIRQATRSIIIDEVADGGEILAAMRDGDGPERN